MANSTKQQEINRRRQIISNLRHEGVRSQQAIADRLRDDYGIKVDRSTISLDLKALNNLWKESALNDTDAYIKELERQYRFAYQQSVAAWERSLEDKESTTQEQIDGGKAKVQIKTEGQSGNPAHLRNAMESLKAIRDMRGLDEPSKVDSTINVGGSLVILPPQKE